MKSEINRNLLTNNIRKYANISTNYQLSFERGKKHGFDYHGFFVGLPKKAWILLCWAEESQHYFGKPFWLELSSRAAKKWRDNQISKFQSGEREYQIYKHPNDLNRLVIPIDENEGNIEEIIRLTSDVANDVFARYL